MSDKRMNISVGVVAWNEESSITAALASILEQTVFTEAGRLGIRAELIVIANGCTDRTVELADRFLARARVEFPDGGPVELRLIEVPEAGFANAWNLLAHTHSRTEAEFIFFVNADIVIDQPAAFERMLATIRKDYDMKMVVSPLGHKHIEAAKCLGFYDRLNLAVTRFTERTQTAQVRGHCFCARASAMRTVWLPKRFPGAVDGLFKRMIISDMAGRPDTPARIGVAPDASYTFEAYRTLPDIWNRRIRLFVGQTYIETLMRHLKAMRIEQPDVNLTVWLRARDEADPSWIHRLVQVSIREHGLARTMPSPWFRFRFWRNPKIGLLRKTGMLPVAVLAFVFDVPVFLAAARRLKAGRVSTVWKDTVNRELTGSEQE
jgi:glycosyltransferase involved in cell wall biosynthesis